MAHSADEAEDLLRALAGKDEECEELQGQLQQLMGEWMFAEQNDLTLKDICWLKRNKISALDTPISQWALVCDGETLITGKTIKECIQMMRAFGMDG